MQSGADTVPKCWKQFHNGFYKNLSIEKINQKLLSNSNSFQHSVNAHDYNPFNTHKQGVKMEEDTVILGMIYTIIFLLCMIGYIKWIL